MTRDRLKTYLEGVIDDIRTNYIEAQEKIQEIQKAANIEYDWYGSTPVRLDSNGIAAKKQRGRDAANEKMQEYRKKAEKLIQEATDHIANVKKAAIQDLTAAEPVPTDVQLRMAEQIKKEYSTDGNVLSLDRVKQFESDMNYHVENETVKAYPYYLAAKDIFGDTGSNAEILNTVYNKLFPDIAAKQAVVDGINELEAFFKTAVICHKFDTIQVATEADQLEMIRMKEELQQLGTIGKLNQRVIRYV